MSRKIKRKTQTYSEKILNRVVLPLGYISCWVILYFLPRRIFHVGGRNGLEPWIIFALIFVVFPALLYLILVRNGVKSENLKSIAFASAFLAIPFMLVLESEDKDELAKFGLRTEGIVNRAWISKRRHRAANWNVQATYFVKGVRFQTSTKTDRSCNTHVGDHVTVIYSSKTPEMSEIQELTE